MRIDVEPAPTGRAFLMVLAVAGISLLSALSFRWGKRSGLQTRTDVRHLEAAADHLRQSECEMLAAIH